MTPEPGLLDDGQEQEAQMLAAEIRKVTDKKRKVILEDGYSFVLYTGEFRKFRICEGGEVPDLALQEIRAVLSKRAKLRCMNLLKVSDRTVQELRDRLRRDGYPEEITEEALAYVASYHYTDDQRYAENYIRLQSGRKSRRVLILELEKRGVSHEVIQEACAAWDRSMQAGADSDSAHESADLPAIRNLVRKKHYDSEQASWEEEQKLTAYLVRKGFRVSDIREVLSENQLS